VPDESAQAAVEELLRKGLGLRDIAAAAGVSVGAAERALAGHGYVRRTTAAALEAAASASVPNGLLRAGAAARQRSAPR
jgi:DNA-binding LacI/PurR family transcriptional regulator